MYVTDHGSPENLLSRILLFCPNFSILLPRFQGVTSASFFQSRGVNFVWFTYEVFVKASLPAAILKTLGA